ncbi:MAG TPA: membrane protein insertase YidC, partial [Acetobacteraceae bacterium]|nr:membrane protein insertase YidC [Acetobacteraceae bacterium]
MDQNRLFLAIAISVAIMLGFQVLMPHPKTVPHLAAPANGPNETTLNQSPTPAPLGTPGGQLAGTNAAASAAALAQVPRLKIVAPRVEGSMSLVGARLDYLVLRDYHETIKRTSPLVQLLEPLGQKKPYYIQYGWSAAPGTTTKLPGDDTRWTPSAPTLSPNSPVTLSWDNGAGVTFQIVLSVDNDYMFTAKQAVVNRSGAPVSVFPWARIRRDYTPVTLGYYLLHEGPLGVVKGTLQEMTYAKVKSAAKDHDGLAFQGSDDGGWAGITDKYWLTAVIPDQISPVTIAFRHLTQDGGDRYQVDFVHDEAETVAPGAQAATTTRVFAGAKVVQLLDHYGAEYHIPGFWRAVDFG